MLFKRKCEKSEEVLNKSWENLLFNLIGEQFEEEGQFNILGVCLSIRSKRNILELWLRDGKDEKLRLIVGEKLREILEMNPNNLTFFFKDNDKSAYFVEHFVF